MPKFELVSDFKPSGDQPQAIEALCRGAELGLREQTLLGVTGSGKTYTMAKVIEHLQKPTLVFAHNKTLAAQLCAEFREFFPNNAVEYFISYFDYYQPEAYLPSTDTYIEKDSSRNDEIDRLRHSATFSLLERRDVIIVASVSCIYSLGDPEEYGREVISLRPGVEYGLDRLLHDLVGIHFTRNDLSPVRSTFRVRGDTVEIIPAWSDNTAIRVEFFGDEIERISEVNSVTGQRLKELRHAAIYPATHHAASDEMRKRALAEIECEMWERVRRFEAEGKLVEAQRLRQRTLNDIEMLSEIGICSGVENYSRILSGRAPGSAPFTLLDYFPKDFLMFIDESHVSVPQIRGMYAGDRSRKETLVEYGFRLPSALDNRPLNFAEFEAHQNQIIYVSATPGEYEKSRSGQTVEQVIRPTGLVDPEVFVRPAEGQIDDLVGEINLRVARNERVLVTTLTKKMAEDLTDYLNTVSIKVKYMHFGVDTLERIELLRDLRMGKFDVLVGINLLREGLDLPEVSLVAILDADKEGFLRSTTSLIQTIGRAARNEKGTVIMYADSVTPSMQAAIDETSRRREIQMRFNREHGITPRTVKKDIRDLIEVSSEVRDDRRPLSNTEKQQEIARLTKDMQAAAKALEFEYAALLRDRITELKGNS